MHVRITTVKPHAHQVDELKAIYHADIVPAAKKAKGNIDVFLLVPVHAADDFLSITMWDSQASADAYESSGLYKSLVDKVRHTFAQPPVLKTYEATK